MTMPPKPTPNQDSDPANAGVERAPPRSAAMAFKATTAIHGAPNEHPMARSATPATTQEALVSMEDMLTSAPDRHQCRNWISPGMAGGACYCRWAVSVIKCTYDARKIADLSERRVDLRRQTLPRFG